MSNIKDAINVESHTYIVKPWGRRVLNFSSLRVQRGKSVYTADSVYFTSNASF